MILFNAQYSLLYLPPGKKCVGVRPAPAGQSHALLAKRSQSATEFATPSSQITSSSSHWVFHSQKFASHLAGSAGLICIEVIERKKKWGETGGGDHFRQLMKSKGNRLEPLIMYSPPRFLPPPQKYHIFLMKTSEDRLFTY